MLTLSLSGGTLTPPTRTQHCSCRWRKHASDAMRERGELRARVTALEGEAKASREALAAESTRAKRGALMVSVSSRLGTRAPSRVALLARLLTSVLSCGCLLGSVYTNQTTTTTQQEARVFECEELVRTWRSKCEALTKACNGVWG